jgi:hypothetical protein
VWFLSVKSKECVVFELEMLQLGACVVYYHSNRLGRMWTSYFAGENGVSLVTLGFSKLHTGV